MKKKQLVPFMAVLLLLAGLMLFTSCVVTSVNSFYEPAATVFDTELLGEWEEVDGNKSLTITEGEYSNYRLTYRHLINEEMHISEFVVYMFKVGDYLYLDLFPHIEEQKLENINYYTFFFIPLHGVMKLEHSGNTIELTELNYDWLDENIDTWELSNLEWVTVDNRIVLTSPTEDLQLFLGSYGGNTDAFSVTSTFEKK